MQRHQKVDATERIIEYVFQGLLKTFFDVWINHEGNIFMDRYRRQNRESNREKSLRKNFELIEIAVHLNMLSFAIMILKVPGFAF